MRLLVVDEEPRVAEGLTRLLSELTPSSALVSASNFAEALAVIRQHPCDVVVTELEGDGIDCAMLLTEVAQRQPAAARLVLSGRHDHGAPFALLTLAHQLLPKPFAGETLHGVLSRLAELKRLVPDPDLQALAGRSALLQSPRKLRRDLRGALPLRAGDPTIRRLFRADPALAAPLMQLASSGFLCGSSKVADIDGALQQLGGYWTERLAAVLAAPRDPEPEDDAEEAVLVARQRRALCIARVAASLTPLPEDAATAYLAGLLCDVGELLLDGVGPDRRKRAAATESRGATHAELGAYLLGLWGLPFRVVEAVTHHHAPTRAAADSAGLTQLVWLATCAVDGETPAPDLVAELGAEALHFQAQQSARAVLLEERDRD